MDSSFNPASANTEELEERIGKLIADNSLGMKPTSSIGFREVAQTWVMTFIKRNQKRICDHEGVKNACELDVESDRFELAASLLDVLGSLKVPNYIPLATLAQLAARYSIRKLCVTHWTPEQE